MHDNTDNSLLANTNKEILGEGFAKCEFENE